MSSRRKISASYVKRETQSALKIAKAYSKQQISQYRKDLKGVISQIDRHIKKLRKTAQKKSQKLRPRIERRIEELQHQKGLAKQKFRALQKASMETWEDVKPKFVSIW